MIRIVTDNGSDITLAEAQALNIERVVLETAFEDGVCPMNTDEDYARFYEKLKVSEKLPITSRPAPQQYLDIYMDAKEKGDGVVVIALSSGLSGTYQGAMLAREMVGGYEKIHIVDTKGATHLISILAQHAAELRARGADAKSIVAACEELKTKIKIYAGVDTMEYLRRGGRLSNFAAVAASFAHLKPVISLTEDGKVAAVGKALGKNKAMQWILERVKEAEIDRRFPIVTLFTCGGKNCTSLENKLKAMGEEKFERRQIGSTIGAHAGPEVYGVLFVTQ